MLSVEVFVRTIALCTLSGCNTENDFYFTNYGGDVLPLKITEDSLRFARCDALELGVEGGAYYY